MIGAQIDFFEIVRADQLILRRFSTSVETLLKHSLWHGQQLTSAPTEKSIRTPKMSMIDLAKQPTSILSAAEPAVPPLYRLFKPPLPPHRFSHLDTVYLTQRAAEKFYRDSVISFYFHFSSSHLNSLNLVGSASPYHLV